LNTEFYGRYSVENDTDTPVYDSVSTRVTNHPGVKEEGDDDDRAVTLAVGTGGKLPLSLLQSVFPGAVGLKYRVPENNRWFG
jgi:hypothetical protein